MAKVSKRSVRYRATLLGARRRCGTCSMFVAPKRRTPGLSVLVSGFGRCTLVEGIIDRLAVCDRWEAKDG